jgi:peptidoglycan/xylan/chitin deacetylase (PgdA/CDA1 family)
MNKFKKINRFPLLLSFKKRKPVFLEKNKSYSLLYHSFTEYDRRYYVNTCAYEKFYQDILKLKKCFNFSNDLSTLYSRSIYLTFDDGYKSALPILEFCELNHIPTIVFLSAQVFQEKLLPKDMIYQVCRSVPRGTRLIFAGVVVTVRSNNEFYRDYLGMNFNRRAISFYSYGDYLDEAEKFFNKYRNFIMYIDDDLRHMSQEDIDIIKNFKYCRIGSHAQFHYDLRNLGEDELMFEMRDSKNNLENFFGKEIECFSCPYGFYNERVISIAKKIGYTSFFTTQQDSLDNKNDFFIPRIGIDDKKIIINKNS